MPLIKNVFTTLPYHFSLILRLCQSNDPAKQTWNNIFEIRPWIKKILTCHILNPFIHNASIFESTISQCVRFRISFLPRVRFRLTFSWFSIINFNLIPPQLLFLYTTVSNYSLQYLHQLDGCIRRSKNRCCTYFHGECQFWFRCVVPLFFLFELDGCRN